MAVLSSWNLYMVVLCLASITSAIGLIAIVYPGFILGLIWIVYPFIRLVGEELLYVVGVTRVAGVNEEDRTSETGGTAHTISTKLINHPLNNVINLFFCFNK